MTDMEMKDPSAVSCQKRSGVSDEFLFPSVLRFVAVCLCVVFVRPTSELLTVHESVPSTERRALYAGFQHAAAGNGGLVWFHCPCARWCFLSTDQQRRVCFFSHHSVKRLTFDGEM